MPIDFARARAETPAAERLLHFDNAGASLMPAPVLAAVRRHLEREAEIGGYEAADEAEDRFESVYGSIARLLNCAREEVALVENATFAWQLAFGSLPIGPGDRILTAMAEYAGNYIAYLKLRKDRGVAVEPVPNDASGALEVAAIAALARG